MITRSSSPPADPALDLSRAPSAAAETGGSHRGQTPEPRRRDRSAWFEALHRASQALPGRPLEVERLLEGARRAARSDDFGVEFGDAGVALGAWLDGIERAGSIDPLGRLILAIEVGWMLRSRLGVRREIVRRPALAREPIRRPLFVIGLPRSGTTLLHRLLASCPGSRAPLMWELRRPEPPPPGRPDHRRLVVRRQLQAVMLLRPDFRTIHPVAYDAPEECVVALHHTFLTMHCDVVVRSPSYLAWLRGQDLRPSYRYHKAMLQLLQHGHGQPHWVLKSPTHLHSLDALLDVYPDALFVHVHRDVTEVAPSGCSLTTAARCIVARRIDRRQLGAEWLENWGEALDRGLGARARIDPARLVDVRYTDLIADPARVINQVWAHFGEPEVPDIQAIVARQRLVDQRGAIATHEYTLGEFGLEAAQVRERFADYVRRFDL